MGAWLKYTLMVATVIASAGATLTACSGEPSLTEEQDAFAYATNVWMTNGEDGAPYQRIEAEGLDEGNAVESLLSWMQEEAVTNRARGAIEDLRSAETQYVRLWRTDQEGYPFYEIALNDRTRGELRWLIGPDGWTFRNGEARAWLQESDFGDFCDLLIQSVEESVDSKAELIRVTGETCKLALGIQ
jgi:hypothetical protein